MIIRLADCPSRPWKNGLGRTREIAVHPAAAGIDDFHWRASVAEVDSDAPFSRFPGIDRHIVLLEGDGFLMNLDDTQHHALTTPFEPFAFPGEADVRVHLRGGATRDFNLMVRRRAGRGEVAVWSDPGSRRLPTSTVLVHVATGSITVHGQRLHSGDSWCGGNLDPATIQIALEHNATVLVVRLLPPA